LNDFASGSGKEIRREILSAKMVGRGKIISPAA
jgi:hypothetical protein